MSVYHNSDCDFCGQIKPEVIGVGPTCSIPGGGSHTEEVMGACLQCLKVSSVEEYYAKVDKESEQIYYGCSSDEVAFGVCHECNQSMDESPGCQCTHPCVKCGCWTLDPEFPCSKCEGK